MAYHQNVPIPTRINVQGINSFFSFAIKNIPDQVAIGPDPETLCNHISPLERPAGLLFDCIFVYLGKPKNQLI
jgi:hypothetical protein